VFVFCALSEQNDFFSERVVTGMVCQEMLEEFLMSVLEEEVLDDMTSAFIFR
jgi:hypothetical protein